jgi:hypothetical protein
MYVFRLFSIDSKGEFLKDVINEGGNPQYKYYYYDAEAILTSMKNVLKMLHQKPEDIIDQNENVNLDGIKEESTETIEDSMKQDKTEL